jgi:hypothetical protein
MGKAENEQWQGCSFPEERHGKSVRVEFWTEYMVIHIVSEK